MPRAGRPASDTALGHDHQDRRWHNARVKVSIPVGGGVISAHDSGGGGAPLVLVHAGWSDQSSWAGLAGRLAGQYRVISYDARGYGESPPPREPFTQLGDLVTVLDHLGVPRAALVGPQWRRRDGDRPGPGQPAPGVLAGAAGAGRAGLPVAAR